MTIPDSGKALRDAQRAEYEARRAMLKERVKDHKAHAHANAFREYLKDMCQRVLWQEMMFDLRRRFEVASECQRWRNLAEEAKETPSPLEGVCPS